MSLSRRHVLAGSLSLLALAGCDRLSPGSKALTFNSTDITGAEFARRLELPDVDGRPRTLADWKGKVTVVFFGYTQCPDVCPTTMADLAAIRKSLGADGDKLQSVFVTIDPERDTPEILKAYVATSAPASPRCAARPTRPLPRRRSSRCSMPRCRGATAATPWTIAPPRSCSTRPAGCGCTCPMAAIRRSSPPTSSNWSKRD
jgi:protein SCO1/2